MLEVLLKHAEEEAQPSGVFGHRKSGSVVAAGGESGKKGALGCGSKGGRAAAEYNAEWQSAKTKSETHGIKLKNVH